MLIWWKSEMNRSFFRCLATCRMRSSACDTLSQHCAWRVLCWSAFPLVSVLGSTGSAADESALFVGFSAVESGEVGLSALPPPARSNGSCGFPASRFPVWTPWRREEHGYAGHEAHQANKAELFYQSSDRISAPYRVPPPL